MQTLAHFQQLLKFDRWANRAILASLENSPQPAEKAVRAFAHLLLTEKVWLQRILGGVDNTGFDFWSGDDLNTCAALIAENEQSFGDFFAALAEDKLDTAAAYKNSRGEQYTNTIREVLTHVFFHSGHHRGQILSHIRAAGQEPPYVDFIGFLRCKA
jgi:uncharacterized damage-inducible protein DinB